MQEKKAQAITVVDLRNINNAVVDYFVICSGTSGKQVEAIADSIAEEVYKKTKENPWKQEGRDSKEWILLDYIDVVAHIFHTHKRAFYALDTLWGDAEITHIENP
ncbi:MAG: ribosome silencing factor [Cytophagales bacterium]|nr:ribosome silencing factor [Cytophagales bacterium]